MKRLLLIIALLSGLYSSAQTDFGGLNLGKYGIGLGLRYNDGFELGLTVNDRLFTGPGLRGTDLSLSLYTEPANPFEDIKLLLEANATFGSVRGLGSGFALQAMYYKNGDEEYPSNNVALGARATPGFISPTFQFNADLGVLYPIVQKGPGSETPLKAQFKLGLVTAFAPANATGPSRFTGGAAGAYLINPWSRMPDSGEEESKGPPVEFNLRTSYHF